MKKLVFAIIVSFAFVMPSLAQKEEPSQGGGGIKIYIDFGRKSKDCTGLGICTFKAQATVKEVLQLVSAIITWNPIGAPDVEITFDRRVYEHHKSQFPNGYLVLEEDYVLDKTTSRALGLPDGHKFKTGKYKLNYNKVTDTYSCKL